MDGSALSGVVPIVAQDTPSIIAERLKQMITDGDLAPGDQLTEVALARAFGVSRGPVREAVQRLTQEGLLVSERNRGTYVPVLARDDVEDVYLLRGALETAALEQLIRHDSADRLHELDELLDTMQSALDAEDYTRLDALDLGFHRQLLMLTGSRRLVHAFDRLSVESMMCIRMLKFSHPAHPDLVEWHRRFVDAVRNRDVEAARAAVAFHNDTVLRDLFSGDAPTAGGDA